MDKSYLDLAVSFFFLVALVLVSRTRAQVSQRNGTSFGLLAAGLSVLAFLSIYTAIQNQLAEQKVITASALAAAEFFRLLMLITGLVLVTSGISKWLPILNTKEDQKDVFINKDRQLKQLARLLTAPASVTEFLRMSLEVIANSVQGSMGTVYTISSARNTARLSASVGRFENLAHISERFVLNRTWFGQLSSAGLTPAGVSFAEIHPRASGNCYCFPVRTSEHLQFLYLIWSKDKRGAESFDREILSSIANAVKMRLRSQRLALRNKLAGLTRDFAASLKAKMASGESINEKFLTIKSEMQRQMPIDFISLSLINAGGRLRRISVGPSGTILNEVDARIGSDKSYLYQVRAENKTLLISDITVERPADFTEFILMGDIKSLMAMPVGWFGQAGGVLTVGAKNSGIYRKAEKEIVTSVSAVFESLLHEMNLEEQATSMREREKLVRLFAAEITASNAPADIFRKAVSAIKKVCDCPVIRISTIDAEAKFMSSQMLVNESQAKVKTPENGHLILSLLPRHKFAQESGDTVKVNCQSGEKGMAEIESMQVFAPGVKSAVIVPIKYSDKVLGLISLADDEVMAASALTEASLQFVETIAALTAVAMDACTRGKSALSEFASAARGEITGAGQRRGMRRQLRSSLTSIIGSLEMIRSGDGGDDTKRNKFLSIIDKSAQKMSEFLAD